MDSSKKPERKNPCQQANLLSYFIFAWAVPFLYHGSRKGLTTDDITECLKADQSEQLGNRLEKEWQKELERARKKSRKPHLRRALLSCFWSPFIINGALCFIYIALKMLIAAILAQLLLQLRHVDSVAGTANSSIILAGNSSDSVTNSSTWNEVAKSAIYVWNDAYYLGGMLVGINFVACFLWHHLYLRQRMMGARMRIACCSLVYRKTLRLSMKSVGSTPPGHLINLISNDVSRLDYALVFTHYIWILPIHSVITCYIIWQQIGIPALVGVLGLLLKTVPVQTALSKLTSVLRRKIAERTDVRVGIMNELMQGIQVIKMYAWENSFETVVADARHSEIQQLRYANYLYGFQRTTRFFIQRTTLFITLAAAALLGQSITADFVFSVVIYYNILQLVAAVYYPLAVNLAAEALVSLRRVQTFLLQEDRAKKVDSLKQGKQQDAEDQRAIILKDITASWEKEKPQHTLQHLNLKILKGQLCAIIGPVGSGKSSFLQLLLGELPIVDGRVIMQDELSYAAQEPWLFTGTVRNNILFGELYDHQRYQDVTRACALATDFQQMSNGDNTILGDRGASLSGGQRARISLARAVYKPASIYLLDDPLSAVDAHVGRHLFDEVIGPRGRLAKQKATRVLVTHQVHFLSEADWIVIVDHGRILMQGTYQDIINSDLDFAKLLDCPTEVTTVQGDKQLKPQAPLCEPEDLDDEVDIDIESEGLQPLRKQSSVAQGNKAIPDQPKVVQKDNSLAETQATGGISSRVWYEYFSAGSTLLSFSFMVCIMLLSQVVCSSSDYFANFWTQQEHLRFQGEPTRFSTYECMYIFGGLIVGVVIMTTFRGFLFLKTCMNASKVLHDRMFNCILHASMRFFHNNNSGRILNRFSKDIGTMDEWLPRNMLEFVQHGLVIAGILAVILVVNPVLFPAVVIVAIIDLLVLKLYMRPSQDLKRMEGICRSPVYSHLTSTLTGISIIRSRQMQKVAAKEFDLLQDVHSSVWQLAEATNTALGLWVDAINCLFLTAVTFSFIVSSEVTYSGNVGLAISQAILLTGMVQYCVRQVAESLQQMTSVERVLEYTELEQESDVCDSPELPQNWPPNGKLEFRDMSLRYDPNGSAVLKHLSLTIEPGWKVGIVGRTGAGKSSLIGALFRLAYIEGGIYIDGIETGSISLETLRTRISIIPQDPVLFSATIRYNLDPFERYSDAELWRSLEDVELRSAIPGLDFMVTERGSNFSVGQRQLLCLARAILRNNKVLVLDEATANVDLLTDFLIQRTIREKFHHCTVVTVAHRLHTVMDSDRIIVMDAGNAVEFDIPHLLLRHAQGTLRQMVEATGGESDALKKVASDSFVRMQQPREHQKTDEKQLLRLLERSTGILIEKRSRSSQS
ncbi:multidrug resistance-associated protein 4-like isoform X2 [Drosophila innubila]|uniref:multidrug resistance-associated protein 4-like isoform X2 n=1 Tax=Drosophila innubila TaxID=198719 RepID=UPI00148D056E|nr:multidrug resistance-associated protein 4-like isoform X2 [Drosophila innubila]